MAIISRISLFSLAFGGLAVTTAAWSQEPSTAPEVAVPAPSKAVNDPGADRPGIIHVSDCPPEDFGVPGVGGSQSGGGMKCPEYIPPHAGWDQPGRRPMYRTWVPYHKFFPDSWTGTAAPAPQHRAPLVYMPTDTTQLGYYYQHVPTWHAYSGMLPPVPRPSDWHYIYREPVDQNQDRPTLAPKQASPTPTPVPDAPADAGLDRSAAQPDLVPVPQ